MVNNRWSAHGLGEWRGNVHDRGIVFLRATVAKDPKLAAENNRNFFSHNSGGGKAKIKVSQSYAPKEETSLPSPNFSWLRRPLVFLGLYLHHCKLCLCLHMAFSDVGFFTERH